MCDVIKEMPMFLAQFLIIIDTLNSSSFLLHATYFYMIHNTMFLFIYKAKGKNIIRESWGKNNVINALP